MEVQTRPAVGAAAETAEEEAVKRNTDCVYFLASPLTCKKGNECEYRHSEVARLNPRDCWYWLNSQCLNPKCAFRHPPLDGLLGTAGSSSSTSGAALPPALTVAPKQTPMAIASAHILNKQSVWCIFFQKGQCLKGDKCPFSHGTQASGSSIIPQPIPKVSPSPLPEQPNVFKKDNRGIKQCNTNHQNISKPSVGNLSGTPLPSVTPSNGLSLAKNLLPPRSQPAMHASVVNSNAWSRAHDHHQILPSHEHHLQNGLEPGEIVEEHSSARFDARFDAPAVVKTKTKGSGSFHNGDDLRRMSSQSRKKPDPPVYGSKYSGGSVNEFDQNGRAQNYNDMRPRRISSERSSSRSLLPERWELRRHKSPDEVDKNKADDLRNRLKQRRLGDGSRSSVSHRENTSYIDEKYRGHHSRRDPMQVPLESSLSTRLRGRISLPRTSPEKERREMVRNQGRQSPTKPISSFPASGRNFGGRLSKREDVDSLNFSGPKSLAELKGAKVVDNSQEQPTKSTCKPEGSPSFEGPKPLSALIKRKRVDELSVIGAENSSIVGDNNQSTGVTEQPSKDDTAAVPGFGEDEVEFAEEEDELNYEDQSPAKEENLGDEDYMDLDEGMEDQELQNSDQKDGDEANQTGDLRAEDEYQEEEEEENELDEEEDFARKVGLLYS